MNDKDSKLIGEAYTSMHENKTSKSFDDVEVGDAVATIRYPKGDDTEVAMVLDKGPLAKLIDRTGDGEDLLDSRIRANPNSPALHVVHNLGGKEVTDIYLYKQSGEMNWDSLDSMTGEKRDPAHCTVYVTIPAKAKKEMHALEAALSSGRVGYEQYESSLAAIADRYNVDPDVLWKFRIDNMR